VLCETKSFKTAAKEAKQRLKKGFWDGFREEKKKGVQRAMEEGMNASKVELYFQNKVQSDIRGRKEEEEIFYQKVKNLLMSEGEVSDAIGRLTDKTYFNTLDYIQKQRYILTLSEQYLFALSRFKREIEFENI
jgi:hypothetical protein